MSTHNTHAITKLASLTGAAFLFAAAGGLLISATSQEVESRKKEKLGLGAAASCVDIIYSKKNSCPYKNEPGFFCKKSIKGIHYACRMDSEGKEQKANGTAWSEVTEKKTPCKHNGTTVECLGGRWMPVTPSSKPINNCGTNIQTKYEEKTPCSPAE